MKNLLKKALSKGNIPKQILKVFHNAFISLDLTKDLNLFDIKKLRGHYKRDYYRLRKGKCRAIFCYEKCCFGKPPAEASAMIEALRAIINLQPASVHIYTQRFWFAKS